MKVDFPYSTFKLVFVDESYCKLSSGASISIMRYDIMRYDIMRYDRMRYDRTRYKVL
jgi:hypothetical protein